MASRNRRRIRRLVLRFDAERYLILLLISFALSIAATRLFLEITGYPQICSSELHLAHVLWGGLIWFAGSLLPLLFANKLALDLGAILSGLGSGLFMDEVGKFITVSNDYFYPAAAPIIYAFFLLSVLIYQIVRNKTKLSSRERFFRILAQFEEIIEGDLSEIEKNRILFEIREVTGSEIDENVQQLAGVLHNVIEKGVPVLVPHNPDFISQIAEEFNRFIAGLFNSGKKPAWLFILWGLLGLLSILHPITSYYVFRNAIELPWILNELLQINFQSHIAVQFLEYLRLLGEGVLGCALLLAFGLGLLGKTKSAMLIAFFSNLGLLVFVNLLVFYYDQFSAIIFALLQLIVFFLTSRYRRFMRVRANQ